MRSSSFVVKELITKCLNLVFIVVGGCGFEESLHACIIGVVMPSEELTGSRVLEKTYIVADLTGMCILEIIHYDEVRDVEKVARILKQFFRVCNCSSLTLNSTM